MGAHKCFSCDRHTMVLHPEAFRKAREKVDRVIGTNRLPNLEDRPNLPYVDSVLKETYRWHAPLPLGIPHYITEDDESKAITCLEIPPSWQT
ncbi:cytochrome P450 [Rhodofomes roseus]|uniref:Cytochrome P450 n=1 Tax=Rhodofomes roseus TaxID=34475 RepID=A0ABQ8KAP5_9APHY|nr:cytochrome P450 [Rhodofomes roseus]KAH9834570.1 cytochrome P450 [Rhodofomes roseus]